MKASSFKLLDSSREVVTTKNGVLDPELVKPAVLGMTSSDIEADAAVENKVTTPKAVHDFVAGKEFLTKAELADSGIYPDCAVSGSTADLNSYRTQGVTVMASNVSVLNGPLEAYPNGCLLHVYIWNGPGTVQVMQYLTVLDTCTTYSRTSNGTAWSDWADPSVLEFNLKESGLYPYVRNRTSDVLDLDEVVNQSAFVFFNDNLQNTPYPDGKVPNCLVLTYEPDSGDVSCVQVFLSMVDGSQYSRTRTEDTWSVWTAGYSAGGAPRLAFTQSDITVGASGDDQNAAYLTLNNPYTVISIQDNTGVQWNLPSQAVTQNGSTTRVDISSVLADKGITASEISGTWYALLAFGLESDAVTEARLLPATASNDDIPIYKAVSIGGGNDDDTKLLLQPVTSDNNIVDQAKGNAAPLTLEVGANVTVNEAGQMVFTSPNSSFQEADVIMISQSQAAQLITGNNEWCVDLVINVGSYVGQETVMTLGGGGEYTGNADYACFIMSTERGTFWHWNGTEINMNLLPGNTVLVTVEQWKDDSGLWRLSYYANGSHVFTSSGEHHLSAAVQPLVFGGGYGKSSYFRNTVDALRFRTSAPYKGQSFTTEERPWTVQQWVGGWGTVPKADLGGGSGTADESRLLPENPSIGDIPYYDGTVTSGGIDSHTQLCLHFDETDGGFKNAVDESAAYIESTATYSSQGKFAGAAAFNGSQWVRYTKTADLNWGADQGTVEGWIYPDGTQDKQNALVSCPGAAREGSLCVSFDTEYYRQKFVVVLFDSLSNNRTYVSAETYPRNTWHHWALVRASATALLFFVNGKKIMTITVSADRTINWALGGEYVCIGYYDARAIGFNGLMDEVRFSNTARWTEDFTPPEKPYSIYAIDGSWRTTSMFGVVHVDAPVDGDIPVYTTASVTGGDLDDKTHLLWHFDEESGAPVDASRFDLPCIAGTTTANASSAKFGKARNLNNSYLTTACGQMATYSQDFTYDGWFYFNELNKRRGLFGVSMGLYVALWEDNTFGVAISTSGTSWDYNHMDSARSTATAQQGIWSHVALVRSKGVVTLYLNGISILSFDMGGDTITNKMGTDQFRIGYPLNGMSSVADFVDEFRFSTVARWTGPFTPPTEPYSVISGKWDKINKSQLVTYDSDRILPTGAQDGNILAYSDGVDRGNGADVRFLLQNALTDSAKGNASPAATTVQGVTLDADNNLVFSGNDSHVTAVLATEEIFAANKEWTIDFWMKPYANSSEWNYILTENTGSWGSHSIGLTWNKAKNVLEQDSGGYVARIIQASNWPNASTPCAAETWHFVAVEKQKTSTGWSLNYYLNGALWLQVAFIGDFVPFNSSNPFWFGGKTSDGGRWFKGLANKLRVTTGARYGGKAFAVPDRETSYLEPAGAPVWIPGVMETKGEDFGYFKLPGGTIVQYGRVTTTAGANFNTMLSVVFPHALTSVTATVKGDPDDPSTTAFPIAVSIAAGPNPTSELYGSTYCIGEQFDAPIEVHWVAIGH